jgi:hypothetical protein
MGGSNRSQGYDQYYQQYMGGSNSSQGYEHFYQQYMGAANATSDSGPVNLAAHNSKSAPSAGFQQYFQQYMGGTGGGSDYSKFYQQYMGGTNASSGRQGDTSSEAKSAPQTGFNSYLERYLPKQDQNSFVFPWTQQYSSSTASFESMHSGGSMGYSQFVDKYSAMAGKHPAEGSGGNWQKHSASQQHGMNAALGSDSPTQFMPSHSGDAVQLNAQPPSVPQKGAPQVDGEITASTSQLAEEASSDTGHYVQFVQWVLLGFSLPAALAFASVMRQKLCSRAMRRSSARDDGFHIMLDV